MYVCVCVFMAKAFFELKANDHEFIYIFWNKDSKQLIWTLRCQS